MRTVCNSLANNQFPSKLAPAFQDAAPDPRLVSIGRAFRDLQEARHQADYNTYHFFQRHEALHFQELATKALADWDSIRGIPQADAFLAGLLVTRHIQG